MKNRLFMNIKLFLVLTLALFFSTVGHTACQRGGGLFDDKDISTSLASLPPSIVITNDNYTAGTVIATTGWSQGNNDQLTIQGCGRSYVVGFFYLGSPQVEAAAGTQIMPTNIKGLGVRVTAMNQAGPNDGATVVDNNWHSGSGSREDHTLRNSQYLVELVATGGPITPGTLQISGTLAQVEFRESASHSADGDVASNIVLQNTQIVIKAVGCNADTSQINFNFNTLNVTDFDAQTRAGSAPDQTVNLTCEPGTNVSLSVTAVEASGDNANHTVMALTGAGNSDVASGIGVQLGLKARTYDSGSDGLPLNKNVAVVSSTRSGSEYTSGGAQAQEQLVFSAVYYKTAATVTAGNANATATLTLTYN